MNNEKAAIDGGEERAEERPVRRFVNEFPHAKADPREQRYARRNYSGGGGGVHRKTGRYPPQVDYQPPTTLTNLLPRPVVIDAANVARTHAGYKRDFISCRGILLCAKYFLERKHSVVCFIPNTYRTHIAVVHPEVLDHLRDLDLLSYTSTRPLPSSHSVQAAASSRPLRAIHSYDDLYVVGLAHDRAGTIISNDSFHDVVKDYPQWRDTIYRRKLRIFWRRSHGENVITLVANKIESMIEPDDALYCARSASNETEYLLVKQFQWSDEKLAEKLNSVNRLLERYSESRVPNPLVTKIPHGVGGETRTRRPPPLAAAPYRRQPVTNFQKLTEKERQEVAEVQRLQQQRERQPLEEEEYRDLLAPPFLDELSDGDANVGQLLSLDEEDKCDDAQVTDRRLVLAEDSYVHLLTRELSHGLVDEQATSSSDQFILDADVDSLSTLPMPMLPHRLDGSVSLANAHLPSLLSSAEHTTSAVKASPATQFEAEHDRALASHCVPNFSVEQAAKAKIVDIQDNFTDAELDLLVKLSEIFDPVKVKKAMLENPRARTVDSLADIVADFS